MQNLIRCGGIFRSGIFAGVVLLVTLFSWSTPKANAAVKNNTVSRSEIREKSQPRTQIRSQTRKIEIDLSQQRLYAWQGKNLVYSMRVSTGKRSTPTVRGRFSINSKYRSARMRGSDYNIPNVPYTMYFQGGYAIHGANWHNNFGTPVSHGCVNLPVKQARRLYKWADVGTQVVVHK